MTIKSSFLLLITSSLLHAGLVRPLPLVPGDAASPDYRFSSETQTGWHSLGVHDLNASRWVRLVDPDYQITDGPVVADAVRFVRTK